MNVEYTLLLQGDSYHPCRLMRTDIKCIQKHNIAVVSLSAICHRAQWSIMTHSVMSLSWTIFASLFRTSLRWDAQSNSYRVQSKATAPGTELCTRISPLYSTGVLNLTRHNAPTGGFSLFSCFPARFLRYCLLKSKLNTSVRLLTH